MEYYDDFLIKIPSNTIKWKVNHNAPVSNKDIVMEIHEIVKILDFLKVNHFTYYLIFRIFAETGMRKGELINIDYNKVKFERRYIDTQGKRGKKVYYISQELTDYLKFYLDSRKLKKTKENALFLSTHNKRYSKRQFNVYLKSVLDKLNINKEITCKTFRSTLNTLRYEMGCPNEERKILLNHKVQDININHYLKLNYKQYLNLFDRWYPYQEIQI